MCYRRAFLGMPLIACRTPKSPKTSSATLTMVQYMHSSWYIENSPPPSKASKAMTRWYYSKRTIRPCTARGERNTHVFNEAAHACPRDTAPTKYLYSVASGVLGSLGAVHLEQSDLSDDRE